ncbi:MAG: pilus assembly protein [Candidatus Omnitrophica bacterium]|nr:pilus assembly protein [Candidatus Omnitrophota bacterium]MDD5671820.1 pilus assembly protein [Candidatus Omnitrophota bacterium]
MKNAKLTGHEKGQTLVEFVFVLILAFLLMAGLISVAQIGYHWAVMHYAASEASRFGSLGLTDPGVATREDSIRNRVIQTAHDCGVDDLSIEFVDQNDGATAGQSSEYFILRLSRPLDIHPVILTLFGLRPDTTLPSHYQLVVQTVIRNEPF